MVDLSKILAKHKKGWLAFSPDWRLVTTGENLTEVLARARKKGVKSPGLLKAAPVKNLLVG